MSKVLVTGGTGFVASHCVLALIGAGHKVRITIRNQSRADAARSLYGPENFNTLEIHAADLGADLGWDEAARGCDYILHTASPFPDKAPRDADELIVPARGGCLRVLRAAENNGVKRVILTSSFGAIGYGHENDSRTFTEEDWTNPDAKGIQPYIKSKTLAERAAWNFMSEKKRATELTVINPVGIFGPPLSLHYSSSVKIVRAMLSGSMKSCPKFSFGIVDVRDLANLQIIAMEHPKAAGQRFISAEGRCLSLLEVSKILQKSLGENASLAPTKEIPNWVIRIAALFSERPRQIAPQLGIRRVASPRKAKELLGWQTRPVEETIADTGKAMLSLEPTLVG